MRDRKIDIRSYLDHVFAYLQRFVEIDRAEFEVLAPHLELRIFDKKKVVLAQGDIENYLNIVMRGMVRKYVVHKRGEATLQLATEGHLIQSEISFHKRTPSEVVLETLEPTIMIAIRYETMQVALNTIPLAEKLGRAIIVNMFIKKDMRYFDELKMTTRERFLQYVQNHPHMLQRVPQKILASYLNIKPETFSRLKHLLRKR